MRFRGAFAETLFTFSTLVGQVGQVGQLGPVGQVGPVGLVGPAERLSLLCSEQLRSELPILN